MNNTTNTENTKETFNYTYSTKEQKELEAIKNKYTTKEEKKPSNYDKIKKLDKKPTKVATTCALIIGISSSLFLGGGMSLVMILGDMFLGILVGMIGLVGMLLSYPLYKLVYKVIKNEVKDEILELCEKELV